MLELKVHGIYQSCCTTSKKCEVQTLLVEPFRPLPAAVTAPIYTRAPQHSFPHQRNQSRTIVCYLDLHSCRWRNCDLLILLLEENNRAKQSFENASLAEPTFISTQQDEIFSRLQHFDQRHRQSGKMKVLHFCWLHWTGGAQRRAKGNYGRITQSFYHRRLLFKTLDGKL